MSDQTSPTGLRARFGPALELKDRLARHQSGLLSAAIAFYAFLALVPTLAALIGLYGLVRDPDEVTEQMADLLEEAPESTREFLVDQMSDLAASNSGALGVSVVISLLIALVSASGAVANLIKALNAAYEIEESRKPWTLRGLALLFLVAGLVLLALVVFLVSVLPPLLADTGLGASGRWLLGVFRFVLLGALMAVSLSVLYRRGPDHHGAGREVSTRPVTVGGLVGTGLFIVLSLLFSLYTANLGSYGETYGPLATIIVLLLWFNLSALAIVIGAEVDAMRTGT